MIDGFLLTSITFLPLIGALVILGLHQSSAQRIKAVTLVFLLLDFLASLALWFWFPAQKTISSLSDTMVFRVVWDWIPAFGIKYAMGVDGISLLLVLLTTFLGPLVLLGAWNDIKERVLGFCFCLLLLQTGMLGAFMATDMFLFYVFWEVMLIPMYFLIGIWGGKRRIYAAIKLLLYTMLGSLLMLVAIIYMGVKFGTFDLLKLYQTPIGSQAQHWLFFCFALAFLIKVPMFPFHTWLPDAHVEAPTPGSVILAGVLLKLGTYGFIRYAMPLFPQALETFSQPLMILAVIGIIYGALVAMVQPDIKKLVAYSSVSHLGFVMLGLLAVNVQGVQGGILQMINHGLSTGALFLLVGMIYERRHTRMIADYGGIAKTVPLYAFFFVFVTLSSIGLPGLNGFVGEFLILIGAFAKNKLYAFVAGFGIILGAVYMLWLVRRFLFGPLQRAENRDIPDLNQREFGILVALSIFIVWIGVAPGIFLDKTTPSVNAFLQHVKQRKNQAHSRTHRTPPKRHQHPAARR